jgi:hypothetical protein
MSDSASPTDVDPALVEISNADSGRMGTAVEHLIAASCILATRGALNVSTSLIDDEGVDLVFHARGSTRTLAVQVKSRMSDTKGLRVHGNVSTTVRQATFTPRKDLAMLFVAADVTNGHYTTAWLAPSLEFVNLTTVDKHQRRGFTASIKPGSKDKWVRYRHTPATLPSEILRLLTT